MSYIIRVIRRRSLLCVLLAAWTLAGGCAKDVPVTYYPTFYDESVERVGVARFRNRSGNARAGLLMARALTRALEANGTYRVGGPVDIHRLLQDPAEVADPNKTVEKWVPQLRAHSDLDAVVTGVVLAYQAGQYYRPESSVGVRAGVGYGRGGYPYRHWNTGVYGYRRWPVTYRMEREAVVSVKITLTRLSDGETLYTTAQPVRLRLDSYDVEGDVPAEEMLGYAADRAAVRLAERLAPSKMVLELKPDQTLKTADGFTGGEYNYTDDFRPGDTLYAVLSLPKEADRNTFRLAIIQKEGAAEIASQEIVWDRAAEKRSATFDVDQLLEEAPPGKFLLKLYSGDVFAFEQDFEIKPRR